MSTSATLVARGDPFLTVDLDSCAQVNVVDMKFVRKHRLPQVNVETPTIHWFNESFAKVYGVYTVPLTLTDFHGVKRTIRCKCVGTDRDPRESPVLLGTPGLNAFGILLFPRESLWWFVPDSGPIRMLNPKQFAKQCRKEARVFALSAHPDVPQELFPEEEEEEKTPQNKDEIPPELSAYADVLDVGNSAILPSFKNTDHEIDLKPGTVPPVGPIYSLSAHELKILKEYLDENLAKGRIRHSRSPAASPVLFVPKKDGSLRLCVDYRGLNRITIKNRYPLPLISEIMDRASGAKFFSKLDVKDAYYRIRVKEGDEWKTAFRTRYGLYEYLVMPFGLTNAPATFQSYIHQALGGLLDEFCVAYLDDILIFSQDRESHTKHIQQVLERLRTAQLYCKPSKCEFYRDHVSFLGYEISQQGIAMESKRIQTIAEWPEPKTFRDIQVFIGFCNFYRRFIHKFAAIAHPLTSLLKGMVRGRKPGEVHLTPEEREAFDQLRKAFQDAPVLIHFDPSKPVTIETDASDFAMGAVLSQTANDGRKHPIAFWSAKFSGPAKTYGIPDKEMMAIVESFKHWRHYLEGSPEEITVLSDHNNLQGFMRQPKLNGRQARWCMYLAGYDFVIRHQAGKRNPADGPSRRPDYMDETPPTGMEWMPTIQNKMAAATKAEEQPPEDLTTSGPRVAGEPEATMPTILRRQAREMITVQEIYAPEFTQTLRERILALQKRDDQTRKIKEKLSTPRRVPSASAEWSLGTAGELLHNQRLLVPNEAAVKQEILHTLHDDPMAGHFGPVRTLELIQRKFYWETLRRDVREYCRNCQTCQTNKPRRHQKYGSLESLPIPSRPWEEITMDFIVGLPTVTMRGGEEQNAILVVVDRFTKMNRFFAVSSEIKSQEMAELLHKEIELKYGIPNGCVSDRGSVFTSQFWSDLCYLNRVHRKLSTAFHPQTDGQTERSNQTLIQYLRCFGGANPMVWAQILPEAEFVCNNAINATTKMSPFQALMGYNPTISRRVGDDAFRGKMHPNAVERVQKLESLRQELRRHWDEAVASHKRFYDRKHVERTFKRGDLVLLSTQNLKLKTPKKFAPKFVGPFRILETVGSLAYRLALPEQYSRLHDVFSVSLLEPWYAKIQEDREMMPMPPLEEDEEWEVEEVRAEKQFDGETFFLVKWTGWPSEFNQWVSEDDIKNAWKLVIRFRQGATKRKRQRLD